MSPSLDRMALYRRCPVGLCGKSPWSPELGALWVFLVWAVFSLVVEHQLLLAHQWMGFNWMLTCCEDLLQL